MLSIHGIPATALRSWDHQVTEFEPTAVGPSHPDFDVNFQGANFPIEAEEGSIQTSEYGYSTPASASSVEKATTSHRAVHYSTHSASSDALIVHDAYSLDTTTFPQHAVHLLPTEPNGTWRARTSYAMVGSSESASTLPERLKDYRSEFNALDVLAKLNDLAQDGKDELESWLNKIFAETDLSETHDRIRRAVFVFSMPNMRQFDKAVDQGVLAMTEVTQSSQERRSESDLLEEFKNDKYMFADILSRMAQRALVEQGICKKWQLECARHVQQAMQTALLHTFVCIQQVHEDVGLFRAQPRWNADREKKVWRLELDVGKVGIETRPVTDRSLIELGPIDTGFELPESCCCASIADLERQIQDVDEGWQLLEA